MLALIYELNQHNHNNSTTYSSDKLDRKYQRTNMLQCICVRHVKIMFHLNLSDFVRNRLV